MVLLSSAAVGCDKNGQEAKSPDYRCQDTAEKVGNTVGQSLDLAAKSAAEGVDTFGSATAEFFTEGADAAGEEWDEEAAETKRVSREEAEDVRRAADSGDCE